MELVWAVPLGVVVGLVLGGLGGGGAILAVPALVYLLGVDPHEATSASLLVVALSGLAALQSHARQGNVRVAPGFAFGALGLVGNVAGVAASRYVPSRVLLGLFAGLMLVMAAAMILRLRRPPSVVDDAETPLLIAGRPNWRAIGPLVGAATVVGFLTGFLGVGGGFMIVPVLTVLLGYGMRAAVGTSLLIGAVNSAIALTTRFIGGVTLPWPLVLTFTAAAMAGSLIGARVSRRVSPSRLSGAFAVLLVVVATYMAIRVALG